jgi:MFS family permease
MTSRSGVLTLDETQDAVCRKVVRRLTPVLFLSYLFCSMDRFNISFAQLQLHESLKFSDATYGLGASLFFVTYVLFEVPASILLRRFGARRVFCTIMAGWGLCSSAMLFVRTPHEFYAARLLLGVLEAGFYPGVIYYLSSWLPQAHRSKAIAIFASGIVIAGVVVGPLSGWIMTAFDGAHGLAGWQWLFLLEGLPSIVMAVICAVRLADRPDAATWLTADEAATLEACLVAERELVGMRLGGKTMGSLLREPRVYLFALVFFCATSGIYALNFWVPSIIKGFGQKDPLHIGLYSMIPWGSAAIATVLIARHSDRIGIAGVMPRQDYIFGATANAALVAFTQAVGVHATTRGVRVVGVNPGPCTTERLEKLYRGRAQSAFGDASRWKELLGTLPFGRASEPEEMADLVAFLASARASYLSGVVIDADGGARYR